MKNKQSVNSYQQSASLITLHALRNERGIALVMVLVLSAISLTIMAGLIYMLTSGTQISGMGKRYKTALEAGKGGRDVSEQIINLKASETEIDILVDDDLAAGAITTPDTCVVANTADTLPDTTTCADHIDDCDSWVDYPGLCVKLTLPEYCWSGCDNSLTIDPVADPTSYDMRFTLGDSPLQYTVYAKIVDTVWGNSSSSRESEFLGGEPVVGAKDPNAPSVPFLYTIEIDSQNADNRAERAKLSVLYQY